MPEAVEEVIMQPEELVAHCLAKPGVEGTYLWGEAELVTEVCGKAFGCIGRYGWTAVGWTGPVPDDEVRGPVDASYDAIVAALPKRRRP